MIAPAHFSSRYSAPGNPITAPERAVLARKMAEQDAALVARFIAGDESAFVEIMARHREKMYSIALAMLHNHADAEEITQDTFIRAHRGLAKFRGDASLVTWLHRITLNLARNRYWYYHRRRRHATFSLDVAFGDSNLTTFADLMATDAADPVREAAASEFSELVDRCTANLSEGTREILTMRNALNHSYVQIARNLGISIGTVKSRLARARERLRVQLAAACPEFGAEARPEAWFDPVRPVGRMALTNA